MKIHSEDIAGGILVSIAIFVNAILDYFNRSTVQAVVNAICAFIATLIVKFIYEKLKKLIKK